MKVKISPKDRASPSEERRTNLVILVLVEEVIIEIANETEKHSKTRVNSEKQASYLPLKDITKQAKKQQNMVIPVDIQYRVIVDGWKT